MCELPLLRSLMLVVFDGGFFLLLLRPPRTTLTDTLFPYTARCRSGQQSRRAITLLTLFGGLASTACWPLSAYLVEAVGWRGTCATYASIHLFFTLPLYLFAVPREPERHPTPSNPETGSGDTRLSTEERRVGKECVSKCRSRWSASH